MLKKIIVGLFAICILTGIQTPLYAVRVKYGPVQEIAGPGGRDYKHQSFKSWESGIFPHERYIVFEPSDPAPEKAGFVLGP